MKDKYEILRHLYEIVRDQPQPLEYYVGMRELILRLKGDWQTEHLEELSAADLIYLQRTSTGVVIFVTESGMEKARVKFSSTSM